MGSFHKNKFVFSLVAGGVIRITELVISELCFIQ